MKQKSGKEATKRVLVEIPLSIWGRMKLLATEMEETLPAVVHRALTFWLSNGSGEVRTSGNPSREGPRVGERDGASESQGRPTLADLRASVEAVAPGTTRRLDTTASKNPSRGEGTTDGVQRNEPTRPLTALELAQARERHRGEYEGSQDPEDVGF